MNQIMDIFPLATYVQSVFMSKNKQQKNSPNYFPLPTHPNYTFIFILIQITNTAATYKHTKTYTEETASDKNTITTSKAEEHGKESDEPIFPNLNLAKTLTNKI